MTSTTLPRSEFAGLSAIDLSQGRPVVLLHGVGLNAEVWEPQIGSLRGAYRVIAPDMPGHGHSPCPKETPTLEHYVQSVGALIEALPEPALVIGHSMGAVIALEVAAQVPSKVCAVAALNAIFERSPEASAAVRARAVALDGMHAPDPTPTLKRWFGYRMSPERAACERWLREVDPKGYKLAYTAFAETNGPSRAAIRALTCRALFVTGALEPNSTPEMSRAMAALAPKGRALVVAGAAHMMPLTHAEEVNAAILALAREAWT